MLAARLVFSEDWVLTVTAAFGQRKRILRKIERRENGYKKENSHMITAQTTTQPRSPGLFPGLRARREKALASAGHVPTLHPEILGVIN